MSTDLLPAPVQSFDRILVLDNPCASNGARGRRQFEDLQVVSGLDWVRVVTDMDPEVTASKLDDRLEPNDLVYVVGGDGTVNSALYSVMAKRKNSPVILASRSGNANDFAMAMNGKREPWQVFADYRNGLAVSAEVHPIEISVGDGDEFVTRVAANYASFGYAALASKYVSDPWKHSWFRRGFDMLPDGAQSVARLPREAYLLAKAALDSHPFLFADESSDVLTAAADISVVHSPRMAKVGRFGIKHTDPFMLSSVLEKMTVPSMAEQLVRLKFGRMVVEKVTEMEFRIANTFELPLYYQVDGEAFLLPNEGEVTVDLAQDYFRVLSTQLLHVPTGRNRR